MTVNGEGFVTWLTLFITNHSSQIDVGQMSPDKHSQIVKLEKFQPFFGKNTLRSWYSCELLLYTEAKLENYRSLFEEETWCRFDQCKQ